MAEVKKTESVVIYNIKLDQKEMNILVKLLDHASDMDTPGSYDLWSTLNEFS